MKIPGLGEKGKYATLIGIVIAVIVTVLAVVSFFLGKLTPLALVFCGGYVVSIVYFILPSEAEITAGKFTAKFKD